MTLPEKDRFKGCIGSRLVQAMTMIGDVWVFYTRIGIKFSISGST